MFFDGWQPILRVLLIGACAYVFLLAAVRLAGKRSLAQLNAFDLIVSVALGSTLATVILARDVALATGVTALALLVALQWGVAWLSVRLPRFSRLVKAEPRLVFHAGAFLDEALRRERIKREEVLQALRNQGVADLAAVDAVVVETNGSFSVLRRQADRSADTLENVEHDQRAPAQR